MRCTRVTRFTYPGIKVEFCPPKLVIVSLIHGIFALEVSLNQDPPWIDWKLKQIQYTVPRPLAAAHDENGHSSIPQLTVASLHLSFGKFNGVSSLYRHASSRAISSPQSLAAIASVTNRQPSCNQGFHEYPRLHSRACGDSASFESPLDRNRHGQVPCPASRRPKFVDASFYSLKSHAAQQLHLLWPGWAQCSPFFRLHLATQPA